MELILIILINIIFLIVHLTVKNRLKKTGIMKKQTATTLNGLLYGMLAAYIAFNFILLYKTTYESFFDPIPGTVITATAGYLLLSPFFWVSSLHFLSRMMLYTRINMKARVSGDIMYYRDDLQKVHPGLLSLLYNFRAGEHSDIAAVLLKLKLEGYIVEENGVLRANQDAKKNAPKLLPSEKTILQLVAGTCKNPAGKPFNLKDYSEAVKAEALEQRLISGSGDSAPVKAGKILLNILLPIAAVIAIIIGADAISGTYSERTLSNSRSLFVEVDKETYDEFKTEADARVDTNDPFATAARNLSNPVYARDENDDGTYTYYIRADQLDGVHAALGNTEALEIITGIVAMLSVFMIIILISLLSSQVKSFKYDFTRTPAGYKLINEAIGLKNFLSEFSVMARREGKELPLWEYYMIYAVVLEVNITIEDKVIAAFADSLSAQ